MQVRLGPAAPMHPAAAVVWTVDAVAWDRLAAEPGPETGVGARWHETLRLWAGATDRIRVHSWLDDRAAQASFGLLDDRVVAVTEFRVADRRQGVEVMALARQQLLAVLMRLVPECGPGPEPGPPLELPPELGLALARAVGEERTAFIPTLLDLTGLAFLPPLLADLTTGGRGGLEVVWACADAPTVHLTWLLHQGGWARLSVAPDGDLRHTPCTRGDIRHVLRAAPALCEPGSRPP